MKTLPPTKILQYDEEVMTKALDDVMRGVPVYAAAKKYKILQRARNFNKWVQKMWVSALEPFGSHC